MKTTMTYLATLLMLGVLTVACNKIENAYLTPEDAAQETSPVEMTFTAKMAAKDVGTKAVDVDGVTTWVVDERIAVYYQKSDGSYGTATANVDAVNEGVATISASLTNAKNGGTVKFVYPASLVNAKGDDIDVAKLESNQHGTISDISKNFDAATGSGTLVTDGSTCGTDATVALTNRVLIGKFTPNFGGAAIEDITTLTVSDGTNTYFVKPSSDTFGTTGIYVAMLPVSGQVVSLTATTASVNYIYPGTSVTLASGKFYNNLSIEFARKEQFVEMGNGLKWAICNVGASSQYDYGDYFAWGETVPYYKEDVDPQGDLSNTSNWKDGKTAGYAWGSYSLGNGSSFTKYTGSDYTVLQPEDDAAHANLGGTWRMPTKEEWLALKNTDYFDWVWQENYNNSGCNGYLVTSKITGYAGNSIFLPAGGYRYDRTSNRIGQGLHYWSSSLNPSNSSTAYGPDSESGGWHNDYDARRFGHPVRAVFGEVITPITDLSATATANTYLVSEPGKYRFKATVKGNGGLDPLTGTTATTIDPACIAGVKVLWELYGQGRAIRHDDSAYDISYSDGYVYFSTPDTFTPGDACVAIYDSEGTILWSWLIWATPEPGTMTHNEATFMDRNLGAIDVGNCMRGFLFEWGRKDAFSAANGGYDVYPYVPVASSVFTHSNGSASTMAYTIAHPTEWIRPSSGTSWMSAEEYEKKPWLPDVKTIYDPCPAGWRIPTQANISDISGLPDTGLSNGYDPEEYYKGFGNPGTGYYWTASTDEGADGRAYAFCNDGRNLNHWGQDQGYAIRPVRE